MQALPTKDRVFAQRNGLDVKMNNFVARLSDADLLSRLTNFEDHFVERKTSGDHAADWLKTIVAFANSMPIGYPAVLFIGVRDDGTPEGNINLDGLQKKLAQKMTLAYPPIYFMTKVLSSAGKQFLAVLVPGSSARPHFAGPSYVRKGSTTSDANEDQFEELVTSRQSKARELLQWVDKVVSVDFMRTEAVELMGAVSRSAELVIIGCNAFYATLRSQQGGGADSIPLRRIEISFDNPKNRLKLEVYPV
jgi:predicted HTH transcriptional regulator